MSIDSIDLRDLNTKIFLFDTVDLDILKPICFRPEELLSILTTLNRPNKNIITARVDDITLMFVEKLSDMTGLSKSAIIRIALNMLKEYIEKTTGDQIW